jgi:hypothetical protein
MIKDRNIHSRAGIGGSKVALGVAAHLGAPIIATTNRITALVDWANGALAIAAQPDVPRNITCTLTDANASVTAGTLTVTGLDPEGNVVVEVITAAQARAVFAGTKIFASVTSVVIAGSVGQQAAIDQVIVGVGNVIGLPSTIQATSQVKHVYLAGVRQATPVITAGRQRSGVNASAGTYDGAKQLRVHYNTGLSAATR